MPHSHHSHSGQFCPGHAKDSLESIIQHAISLHMSVLALTEHMPRHETDRYPGEDQTLAYQQANEASYVQEALRLGDKYASQIYLPVGFESDWIRPESADLIEQSIRDQKYDFFMGSVHHVHTVPIDYDDAMYREAREKAGGTDERLFEDYFDAQFNMLKTVRPPVIGHFDLIRLKSDDPNVSMKNMGGVWERILRNLDFVKSYAGVLEINSSALRKGMDEPYPKGEICQAALERGIRFCLSDDSHGIDQVVHSYDRVLKFLEKVGIQSVAFVTRRGSEDDNLADLRFPTLCFEQVDVGQLKHDRFWQP